MFRRLFSTLSPKTPRAFHSTRRPLQTVASLALTSVLCGLWPAINQAAPKSIAKPAPKALPKFVFKAAQATKKTPTKTAALPRMQRPQAVAKPITKPVAKPVTKEAVPVAPPIAPPPALPETPPMAQAYAVSNPPAQISKGEIFVPIQFLANAMGASTGPLSDDSWRVIYFDHTVDVVADQTTARFDDTDVVLAQHPRFIGSTFYVPLQPFAQWFGFQYRIVKHADTKGPQPWATTFLITYAAAIIEDVQTRVLSDKVQTVVTLSNPTRIVAAQNNRDVNMSFAAARRPIVPTLQKVNDYMVPHTAISSGNWHANLSLRINYQAPVQWFTAGSPARVIIEVQRLFEEAQTNSLSGGIAFTKIRKGTDHGPVQMFLARVDPQDGWRMRVAPAGYSVMQRARPSQLASRHKALLAVNGGFFAYDGAAVGAMLVNNEWIRLPWGGRTAIGFKSDGSAQIGRLQVAAEVQFGSANGPSLPVRELNGWPDSNRITALTTRFGPAYKLSSGEMAIVVKDGKVIARPGGGYAPIYAGGFTLVAGGAARPYLKKIKLNEMAQLKVSAPGWEGVTTALGGGPRLVENSQVRVSSENFRADVRMGRGPRTAIGIDKNGGYIVLVVDGRQGYYSTGLTLTELAYTMLKFGAVDAINLDGGGSTAMVVRNRLINRPSDGTERSVSNVLMVMR